MPSSDIYMYMQVRESMRISKTADHIKFNMQVKAMAYHSGKGRSPGEPNGAIPEGEHLPNHLGEEDKVVPLHQ